MRNANVNKMNSLDCLVIALCRDYERRERAIREGIATRRTLVEFRYYNFKIVEATCEVVSENEAMIYIKEIGENIGYANSRIPGISEVAYKKFKKLIRENIAKKLHLSD